MVITELEFTFHYQGYLEDGGGFLYASERKREGFCSRLSCRKFHGNVVPLEGLQKYGSMNKQMEIYE